MKEWPVLLSTFVIALAAIFSVSGNSAFISVLSKGITAVSSAYLAEPSILHCPKHLKSEDPSGLREKIVTDTVVISALSAFCGMMFEWGFTKASDSSKSANLSGVQCLGAHLLFSSAAASLKLLWYIRHTKTGVIMRDNWDWHNHAWKPKLCDVQEKIGPKQAWHDNYIFMRKYMIGSLASVASLGAGMMLFG
jgi:hypothetical protein